MDANPSALFCRSWGKSLEKFFFVADVLGGEVRRPVSNCGRAHGSQISRMRGFFCCCEGFKRARVWFFFLVGS